MATAMKKCKVCDKMYPYCNTAKRIAGVFRWQDVACCPEHGSIYLARIEASRSETKTNNLDCYIDDSDEYDELFEEDFDDEE